MKKINLKNLKLLKIKDWVELIGLFVVVIIILGLIFRLLFIGESVTKNTPNGETYTCYGGLIKICGGSSEAAKYLGV